MKKAGVVVAVISVLVICSPVLAGEYFGLNLGEDTIAEVRETLFGAGAKFDENYGYKGYTDLKMIKVSSYARFNRLGQLREAWISFDPQGVLYKISITWSDAGDTFQVLKDGLAKYPSAGTGGFGFQQTFKYRDGKTDIELERNNFAFGSQKSTSLTYTLTSALPKVDAMKAEIEEMIRKENARKAGGDI